LSVYLDASIPVSLFTIDTLTARADAVLRARPPLLMVSNLAAAEFASATTRRVRMQLITAQEAHAAFSTFDARIARTTTPLIDNQRDLIAAGGISATAEFDAAHRRRIAHCNRAARGRRTFDLRSTNGKRRPRPGHERCRPPAIPPVPAQGSAPASGLVRRRASSAGWSRMWCIGTPGACPDRRSDTPSAPSAPPRGIRKGSA
jgi:hypothetical protein